MKRQPAHYGPMRPQILFLAFWAAGVLLPLIPFIHETDGFSIFWGYDFRDKDRAIAIALSIYAGVLMFVSLGIWMGIAMSRVHAPRRLPRGGFSFELRCAVIAAIGFASIALTIVLVGGLGNWLVAGADRVRQFAGLNFIVLLQNSLLSVSLAWFIRIARPGVFTRDRHPYFIAFALLALLLVAVQGAKSTVFVYLLGMLVIWHVRVHRLPIVRLGLIGALTFVLLMLYHVFKQEYLVVGEFVFYDQDTGFFASLGNMLFQQLTGNLMQLQCMAVLVDAMPEQLDYQNGESLKMVFLIWLPSMLFPDKPPTAPGVFTMAMWPERLDNDATTMPPGLFGELYMNFGWSGTLVGALLFGIAYGIVYGRSARTRTDVSLGLYAVMVGVMLHYFRGELASVTVLLASMGVPLWWMLRGQPARPAETPPAVNQGDIGST